MEIQIFYKTSTKIPIKTFFIGLKHCTFGLRPVVQWQSIEQHSGFTVSKRSPFISWIYLVLYSTITMWVLYV